MGVGQPHSYWLQQFGAFGEDCWVFHVGSSLELKDGWRDVDVRVCISDEEWKAWGFPRPRHDASSPDVCSVVSGLFRIGKEDDRPAD